METWKSIPEFPGYDASTWGRIRSYYKKVQSGWDMVEKPQRILAAPMDYRGYRCVRVKHESGELQHWRVHQLIALTFLGSPPDGKNVCHNDGNSLNNHINNLRYDTPRENQLDAIRHGNRKFTEDEILDIRKRRHAGEKSLLLANEYDVSRDFIYDICSGDSYCIFGGPLTKNKSQHDGRKLSDKAVKRIRTQHANGKFITELAKEYNVHVSYVSLLVRGKKRKKAGGPTRNTRLGRARRKKV